MLLEKHSVKHRENTWFSHINAGEWTSKILIYQILAADIILQYTKYNIQNIKIYHAHI